MKKLTSVKAAWIPLRKLFWVSLYIDRHLYVEQMEEKRYMQFCGELPTLSLGGVSLELPDADSAVTLLDYFYKVRDSYLATKKKGKL